jgi:Pyruvate/2-oxoacid:ferredoxin oxidoreductase delta subunit
MVTSESNHRKGAELMEAEKTETGEVYDRLAEHLSTLGMGYPVTEDLLEILRENFSPEEARVALALPTRIAPLQPVPAREIVPGVDLPEEEVLETLERLAERGLLFCAETAAGERGYALQQVGFGFPQLYFWRGEETDTARHMAGLVAKYFNRKVTRKAYASGTQPYRYVPVSGSLAPDLQAVLPHHAMDTVLDNAQEFAVCHCACRMTALLRGRACEHPTEVCLKFDEMARYVIDRGLGREIDREEAGRLVAMAAEQGLVHFVDNAGGDIKHNCNCCGCACWNVGSLRRRKIPRDAIMATYFLRETDEEACSGCGACAEICPVEAVTVEDGRPVIDLDWCIGCGVCVPECPGEAAGLRLREDRSDRLPAERFQELHRMILREKGLL